ncbi:MAG: metallophosphoesterase family protein [Myxococcota bacterium]
MEIAVISDLHLGRGDASDRFGHDDGSFLRFLDFLERNFERIVLLGDVWETLAGRRPFAQVEELRAARAAHPEIAARFRRPAYTYLHGNHDLVAAHVDAAADELVLRADGVRVLFTHGHLYDWIVQRARWASETAVWLGGWLLRLGLAPVFHAFEYAERLLAGVSENPRECTFQRFALSHAHRREADVVVTGHTHRGVRAEHGDRLYLNSGSCARGHFSYLALDTRSGSYGIHTDW